MLIQGKNYNDNYYNDNGRWQWRSWWRGCTKHWGRPTRKLPRLGTRSLDKQHYCELYIQNLPLWGTPNWGLVLRCAPNQKLRLTRSFQTKVQMRLCCMYGRQLVVSKIYSSEITALETADVDLSPRAGGKLRSTACWFILLPILSLEQSSKCGFQMSPIFDIRDVGQAVIYVRDV